MTFSPLGLYLLFVDLLPSLKYSTIVDTLIVSSNLNVLPYSHVDHMS
jgi:hypothetical protein